MPSKNAKSTPSKTDFVQSLPADLPAKTVLAEAKKAGIKLSVGHVYNIRAVAKKTKSRKTKGKRSGGSNRRPGRPNADGTTEDRFLALVLDVGLVRARDLLAGVRARMAV